MVNPEFSLAEQFALYTRKHCFITGKAGTGKTTLLKRIVEQAKKNIIVVAPTGVAAINAGGVTIHSMFGLPLTCFVPNNDFTDLNVATNRRQLLHDHIHFRKDKLRILCEMDTLIIDEVSMVRSDLLDAIDFVLRTVRRNRQPFGDVQVLLFGDMHQLPPVARETEWKILQAYYPSPYFFDSQVWPQLCAAQIELKTIYRQSDARFLTLLSHIRERRMEADDFERLRERYQPHFRATEAGYVLLSTHNKKADDVNSIELAGLPGRACSIEAQIEGEFPEHLFPCDRILQLKAGAQVMFIRNDTEDGSYYNGKLARISRIEGDDITVVFNDSGEKYRLHREIWENIEYRIDEHTGAIVRHELGSFSQFPLRLAWAITIHKSQGLTFDKVVIDAGRSFAPGQVYVALSRCRSLEGIVLHSLIPPTALLGDPRITEFSATHHTDDALKETFAQEKILFGNYLLLRLFTFSELSTHLQEWGRLLEKKEIPDKEAALALLALVSSQVKEIDTTAEKFRMQLQRILAAIKSGSADGALLKERCEKAIAYFTDKLATQLAAPLRTHINKLAYKKKTKRYLAHLQLLEDSWWKKIEQLYQGRFFGEKLYGGEPVYTKERYEKISSSATSAQKEKGGTYRDTLALRRQGKNIVEIAQIRGLAVGTVQHHIDRLIASGEIDVHEVLPAETVAAVAAFIKQNENASLGEIRSGLGNRYDYGDIRMVRSHVRRIRRPDKQPDG